MIVDFGGGLGILYLLFDDLLLIVEFVVKLGIIVSDELMVVGLLMFKFVVEFGCVIVGLGIIMLYEVGIVKDVDVSVIVY